MEWSVGNLFIRPNVFWERGGHVLGHTHNFHHTTFIRKGWALIRQRPLDGRERVEQFVSPEYIRMRKLLLQFAPGQVLRPVRFDDTVAPDPNDPTRMRPAFNIQFIEQGAEVPRGAVEIVLDESAPYHAGIPAECEHEIFGLSDEFSFDCTYAHREPQGDVVQEFNGWRTAYI